jgi:hypothetical protein
MCITLFNIQQLLILPTEYIYEFRVILRMNSGYYPKQHQQTDRRT